MVEGMTRSSTPGARAQPGCERRQQQVALEVVGRDGDRGLPASGVEITAVREVLQLAQQGPGFGGQGVGADRGRDAAPALHEQGVARDGTQLVKLVADGGLGHAQALGRTGDRTGFHHRQQDLKQMAVQVQMIEFAHGFHLDGGVYPGQ